MTTSQIHIEIGFFSFLISLSVCFVFQALIEFVSVVFYSKTFLRRLLFFSVHNLVYKIEEKQT